MKYLGLIFALLCTPGVSVAQVISAQDEFVGPFPTWLNVKTGFGAVGDGFHDDTTNIQNCIKALNTSTHPICYFPAGTYKITSTLFFKTFTTSALSAVGLVGASRSTVTISWSGSTNQIMLWVNGIRNDRIERIKFEGNSISGVTGIAHKWDNVNVPSQGSTHHYMTDLAFADLTEGEAAGGAPNASQSGQQSGAAYGNLDSEGILRRPVFTNVGTGISIEASNALNWSSWDGTYTNCGTGMANPSGNGQFNAYRNVFTGSTIADITINNSYYFFNIEDNWSVNSNQFLVTTSQADGTPLMVRGNHIITTTQTSSISLGKIGPTTLVDNFIKTGTGTGPAIAITNSSAVTTSIGNTFCISNKLSATGTVRELDDSVVACGTITSTPPTLPPEDPNLNRTIFEVTAGSNAAAIQTAISNVCIIFSGNHGVVHLQAGAYSIASTITVPQNCTVQVIGDMVGVHGNNQGTRLTWTGAGNSKVFDCLSPCLAKFDMFSLNLNSATTVEGITVERSDQTGALVYGTFLESQDSAIDYFLDSTLNTNLNCEYCFVGVDNSSNVGIRVTGTGGTTSQASFFGQDTGQTAGTLYSVRSGGQLEAEGMYYEGAILPLVNMGATENGNFSLASFKAGVESATCPSSTAMNASGMTGNWFLAAGGTINCGDYVFSGSNASQNFLGLGLSSNDATAANAYKNSSSAGTYGFAANTYDTNAHATDSGTTTDAQLRTMMAQYRATHSAYLTAQVVGTTQVRMERMLIENGGNAIHILPGTQLILTSSPLPSGSVGRPYSTTLTSNETPPITWTVTAGMPAGLALNTSTGVISGTPTTTVNATFTVTATNALGASSKGFALSTGGNVPAISGQVTITGSVQIQ